jgi:hypothetical protein
MVVPAPYKLPMLTVPLPELKVKEPEFPTESKVPAAVVNDAELKVAEPPEATVSSTPFSNNVLTFNVPEFTFTYPPKLVRVPFKVTKPVAIFSVPPAAVSWSVPMNVPEVAFSVPSFTTNPLVNVLTVTTPGDDTFKLPPLKVPIVFPDAANVNDPPLIVVRYAAPPLRLTVPSLSVVNRRLPAPVKLVTPAAPLKEPIVTEPELVLNDNVPALLTSPRVNA